MKTQPAATLLKWLKDNGHKLGALTSGDVDALLASVQLVTVWARGAGEHDEQIAKTWGVLVSMMQPQCRQWAFHGVAHVLDWNDRYVMWAEAFGDEAPLPSPCYRCTYEPQPRPATAAA